ncbi:MFS transporter [Caldicellulosiruptoraceae bacterium PP1]
MDYDERNLRQAYLFSMKKLKKNTILSITDGSIFAISSGMLSTGTVIIYFISHYVHSKTMIGFLTTINVLLANSAQIFVTKKLEDLEKYKKSLIKYAILMRLTWFLLAVDIFLFAEKNNWLFVVLFYTIFSLQGLCTAFTSITWFNLILKLVPEKYRSRFFGIRSTCGGIFETLGAYLMGIILKSFGYPLNYAILFLTAFIIMMISLSFVSLLDEPPLKKPKKQVDNKEYFKNMFMILKEDKNFTRYLLSVALIAGFGKMPFAFQTIFAKDKLGIGTQEVANATTILLLSQTFGYMIWGIVGTKKGFKATLVFSAIIFIPAIILTYFMKSVFIYYISISLFGIAQSARNVNESNLAANLCRDPLKQPSYIGLRNFLMGPFFAFNAMIAGFIIDVFSVQILFIISIISMISGFLILSFWVKEYRV